jgi:hypothetical protein
MKTALIIICVIIITGCAIKHKKYHSLIAIVGGCNSYGYCGVKLRDGTILSDVYQPIIGTLPDCTQDYSCIEVIQ